MGSELRWGVEPPVAQPPRVRGGATNTASTNPAKLSNGVTGQGPGSISEGEKVRVDPREGGYLERAK